MVPNTDPIDWVTRARRESPALPCRPVQVMSPSPTLRADRPLRCGIEDTGVRHATSPTQPHRARRALSRWSRCWMPSRRSPSTRGSSLVPSTRVHGICCPRPDGHSQTRIPRPLMFRHKLSIRADRRALAAKNARRAVLDSFPTFQLLIDRQCDIFLFSRYIAGNGCFLVTKSQSLPKSCPVVPDAISVAQPRLITTLQQPSRVRWASTIDAASQLYEGHSHPWSSHTAEIPNRRG